MLPILEILEQIRGNLNNNNTLILQAPPGAGKSTVLPLELMNEPWLQNKKIIMLEPRRLAARSVASRMASLLNEETGQTIGYRVRFESKTSDKTKIEVVTEGILTRMVQKDNALSDIGLIIFDEFHERSLQADLALALARESQQILREDLRILIMSATLDGTKLSELLNNAPVLTSTGRQFPVAISYSNPEKESPIHEYMYRAITKAFKETDGDILAFFPGAGEILRTKEKLETAINADIYPLYGDLPAKEQQAAILPSPQGRRKIVMATSIAETSLTIDGIKTVIDSGYSRVSRFDPRTGLTRLETVKVTKDAADQRAGRAGRLGPGTCIRMWPEGSHQYLNDHRTPEILEADLSPAVLELSNWGVNDIRQLTWLTPPPAGSVNQSKELLEKLFALENGKITDTGKQILNLPTHPRIAHLLLEGKKKSLTSLAIDIASIIEEKDPLDRDSGRNLISRIEVLRKYRNKEKVQADKNTLERIEKLVLSWRRLLQPKEPEKTYRAEDVGMLLAAAYPERIARKKENNFYKLASGRTASINQNDPLIVEEWICIAHLDAGIQEGKIFLAAPFNPGDTPELITESKTLQWDGKKGMLIAQKVKRIGEIILESKPSSDFTKEERIKILNDLIKKEGLQLLPWNEDTDQLQARVLSLKAWRPNETWPDISKKTLVETPESWLEFYLENIKQKADFEKLDLLNIIKATIPWEQQMKMEELAPEKIKVPSGSLIEIKYFPDGSTPVIAVRLQELFGLPETPFINEGKTGLLIHLLSPGYKPVQVTKDLKSFWNNTYAEVKKELKSRYPKHSWPDDPWTAEAVRGVKHKNKPS
ncbi:MAG: ATP-dependent helicase HrpB [Cytophagaceae bacterium]